MRILPLLALSTAVLLTACGPSQTPGSTPTPAADPTSPSPASATPTPTATPSSSATPTSASAGIRAFDFTTASWFDAESRAAVTLRQGRASKAGYELTLTGEPVFGDLDGDGDEDAVVTLQSQKGRDWWRYAYIWLWKDETARQNRTPVTDDSRCGNSTDALTIEGGSIQLTRLTRAEESCDSGRAATHKVQNTIKLENGFPVRTAPVRAGTARCLSPMAEELPAREVVEGRVYLAPDLKAPHRSDLAALGKVSLGGDGNGPKITDSFVQVLFHAKDDPTTWYCVYFPGE